MLGGRLGSCAMHKMLKYGTDFMLLLCKTLNFYRQMCCSCSPAAQKKTTCTEYSSCYTWWIHFLSLISGIQKQLV